MMALGRDQAIRDLQKALERHAQELSEKGEERLRIATGRLKLALTMLWVSIVLHLTGIGVAVWLHHAD